MIIETPKYTRNILILRKNGIRLYEMDKEEPKKINRDILPYLTITNQSKNEMSKTMDTNNSQNDKNLKEKKKNLFLNNILTTEKDYFLEDYIRQKEVKLIKYKNKDFYKGRKTFFSENKIDNCRTSYFNKEISNYENKNNKKIPIMIKDIEANLILMKKKRNEKYNNYLKNKLRLDLYGNKHYTDFNEKLGVKNIYIKTDIFFKKKKGFLNNNTNFFSLKDFKTFNSTYNIINRKKFKIKKK